MSFSLLYWLFSGFVLFVSLVLLMYACRESYVRRNYDNCLSCIIDWCVYRWITCTCCTPNHGDENNERFYNYHPPEFVSNYTFAPRQDQESPSLNVSPDESEVLNDDEPLSETKPADYQSFAPPPDSSPVGGPQIQPTDWV